MENKKYVMLYDLKTKEITQDCQLTPTEIQKVDQCWLWAKNNKYEDNNVDFEKVGKWMLFVSPSTVNAVWAKIKEAIQEGDLWHAKVSTSDPKQNTHAIMIYTKDYTNMIDVINVLDFLEMSEIKHADTVIRYKTDNQTRAGIYSGGTQRPWIYSSHTIRQQ